jgi:WD40 repeat protein
MTEFEFRVDGVARRVAMSPDGNWIVASVVDGTGKNEWIKVWDLGKNNLAWSHGLVPLAADDSAASNSTMRVALTPNNKLLVGSDRPGEIVECALPTSQVQKVMADKLQQVRYFAAPRDKYNADKQHLVAISPTSPLALAKGTDLTTWKTLPAGPDSACLCAAFSWDGKFLASGYANGKVYFWDVAEQRELLHLDNIGGPCRFIEFSMTNQHLITATANAIQIWDPSKMLQRP